MSDLAPFVAAVLRDKVVSELQGELKTVRAQLEQERNHSQTVAITGPRGSPVYARALFRDGNYDYSPELWRVEFPTTTTTTTTTTKTTESCSMADLAEMEVRIGGICKARLSNGIVEGFVNDVKNNYDRVNKQGMVSIWFGGSSGIWLNIEIQPIQQHAYARLRDFDLSGESFLNTLLQFVPAASTRVVFTEVSFLISYINGAMERWNIQEEVVDQEPAVLEEEDEPDHTPVPLPGESDDASIEFSIFVDEEDSAIEVASAGVGRLCI